MRLGFPLSAAALALLSLPVFSALGREAGLEDAAAVGTTIPKFNATAVSAFDSSVTGRITAYFVIGVTCPATPSYAGRLRTLEGEYRSKGIDFVYVFPNQNESAESKVAWYEKVGLRGAMIDDEESEIARAFGSKKTGEVLLCNKDGQILYRGGIDDSVAEKDVKNRYLADALNEHLAGKPITVTTSKALG